MRKNDFKVKKYFDRPSKKSVSIKHEDNYIHVVEMHKPFQVTEVEEIPEITVTDESGQLETDQQLDTEVVEADVNSQQEAGQQGDQEPLDIQETLEYEVSEERKSKECCVCKR